MKSKFLPLLVTALLASSASALLNACAADDDDDDAAGGGAAATADPVAGQSAESHSDPSDDCDEGSTHSDELSHAAATISYTASPATCSAGGNSITITKITTDQEIGPSANIRVEGTFKLESADEALIEVAGKNGTSGPCRARVVRGDGTFATDARLSDVPDPTMLQILMFNAAQADDLNPEKYVVCIVTATEE